MAIALIKLAQGGPFATSGWALKGTTGSVVTVENDDNTGVASWSIELLYVPPGSALVPGILASASSATPSATFTPDVPGPYRLSLVVYNLPGLVGTADLDIRNFIVPETKHGLVVPPYQKDPDPLPTLASGGAGNKPNETNFDGEEFGWAGSGSDGMLQDLIRQIDASNFDIVPDAVTVGTLFGVSQDTPADAISVWYDSTDDELWWSDKGSAYVRRLDVSTGTPVQVGRLDLSGSGVTMTRKIVTDATHAFCAHLDDAIVTIINKSTNQVVGILDAGATRKARDVVVNGDDIYVCSKKTSTTGEIRKYSKAAALVSYPTPQTAATTLSNPGGGTKQFEELAIGGGKLWATSNVDQEVHKVNLTTLAHEGSQNVSKDTQGVIYAFSAVWVTTGTFADVLKFDPGTFPSAPTATVSTGGFGVKGIAADGSRLYVSDNFGANFVKSINPATPAIDQTVSITGSLADMARDSTYLWVTNQFAPYTGLHRIELSGFTNDLTYSGDVDWHPELLSGDVTGDFRANVVTALQARPVSAVAPTYTGQALRWSGGSWIPATYRNYVDILSGLGSTDQLSYQAIAGLYFDPTAYYAAILPFGFTIYIEALLETTNAANSADLLLYNVTDAAVVGTLTTTSLTPTFVTAGVIVGTAIPLAGKVYELQLKMGAGAGPDFVTCKMARLAFNV